VSLNVYQRTYRNTAYGGTDYWFAYCPKCKKFIRPQYELSKTGRHGYQIFSHKHKLEFIHLISSNSGKRSITISENIPTVIRRQVKLWWMIHRLHPVEIEYRLYDRYGVIEVRKYGENRFR